MKEIRFTVTSGSPTEAELAALEQALVMHERPVEEIATKRSLWAMPNLRQPLKRSF